MAAPTFREPEVFEQAVFALNADATKAFNRGDAKACARFYAEDATILVPDRPPIKGRMAIEALLEDYVGAGTKLASTDPYETGSSGDLGYCAGSYQFDTPAEDGSTAKETGKFVTVFKLQADGSWKAVMNSLIKDTGAGS